MSEVSMSISIMFRKEEHAQLACETLKYYLLNQYSGDKIIEKTTAAMLSIGVDLQAVLSSDLYSLDYVTLNGTHSLNLSGSGGTRYGPGFYTSCMNEFRKADVSYIAGYIDYDNSEEIIFKYCDESGQYEQSSEQLNLDNATPLSTALICQLFSDNKLKKYS